MSYALVGSLGSVATGTPAAPSFGQATTAGNLLIAWIINPNGGTISTSSTGWTADNGAAGNAVTAQVWHRANCGAGESAPSFTNANGNSFSVMLGEFSGGATSSPSDQLINQGGSVSPTTFTLPSADVEAGELVIAATCTLLSKAGTHTSTQTLNNGATATGNANDDSTSTAAHYRFCYGITTTKAAADNVQCTSSSMNLNNIRTGLASFKLAGGNTYTKAGYGKEHG